MNEITIKTKSLSSLQKDYITKIGNGLKDIIGSMDNYQSVCGYNILSAINVLLAKDGLTHVSAGIDKESINDAIRLAVIYRLNTDNKEVFVIIRNEKRGDSYIKKVECKPQYRGHLKILSEFGRNIKKVYPEWLVREGDEFTYPSMRGITPIDPTWTPKSYTGKVRLVVVPIQYKDGSIEYRIAERESVATNIKAQIKQSLMFDKQKGPQVLEFIKDMTLDQLLSDKTIAPYVNDTYTGLSSEEMIITKLILNAIKRVPIDYSNAFMREVLEKSYDNADEYKKSHTAAEIVELSKAEIELKEPVKELEHQPVKVDDDGVVVKENHIPNELKDYDPSVVDDDEPIDPRDLF